MFLLMLVLSLNIGFIQVQLALGGVSEVTTAPSDVVTRTGENAQFFCKITKGTPTDQETFHWSRMTYGNVEESIYKGFMPDPLNKNKYNFTQNEADPLKTNIVVKNLEMKDAGSYKCAPMVNPTNSKHAELVVVDKPIITILDIPEDRKPGRITCDIYYLRSDNMDAEAIEPQLFASIGTQAIPMDKTVKTAPTSGDKRYKLSLFYNGIMDKSQHGQNFTCGAQVRRDSPTKIAFTISVNKELQIKSLTTKVVLKPKRNMYYPGDSINCTADGHPEPKKTWIPVISDGAGEKTGCTLVITEEMLGNNIWKCRVEQSGNQLVVIDSQEISFSVKSSASGQRDLLIPVLVGAAVCITLVKTRLITSLP